MGVYACSDIEIYSTISVSSLNSFSFQLLFSCTCERNVIIFFYTEALKSIYIGY
jgi:hypothetical protein